MKIKKSIIFFVIVTVFLCAFVTPASAASSRVDWYSVPQGYFYDITSYSPQQSITTNSNTITFYMSFIGVSNYNATKSFVEDPGGSNNPWTSNANVQIDTMYGNYLTAKVVINFPKENTYRFTYTVDGVTMSIDFIYDTSMFIIQNSRFHKVDIQNGAYQVLGQPEWEGTSFMTTLYYNNWVMAVNNNTLHRVNQVTGEWEVLGQVGEWSNVTAMTSNKNKWGSRMLSDIFIIQDSNLYKVNKYDGSRQFLSNDWGGPSEMACIGSDLYIVCCDSLHKVNPDTGAWEVIGNVGNWSNTTSMASDGQNLFIVKNSTLYKVNPSNATSIALSSGWTGQTELICNSNILYMACNGTLYKIYKNTGYGLAISNRGDWVDTQAMTN